MRPCILRIVLVAGLIHGAVSSSLRTRAGFPHTLGHGGRRDLGGLLGGWEPEEPGYPQPTESRPSTKTEDDPLNLVPLMSTSNIPTNKAKETASQTSATTTGVESQTTSTSSATTPASDGPPASVSPTKDAHGSELSAAPGTTSTWKIIGVAVIAFSAVAAVLIAAVFFDHWWRFVRDVLGKRRVPDGTEELIPDWEKGSWEVRFGDDRHRYPSFTSFPSGAPGKSQLQREGSRKVKEWTATRRLSGGASGAGTVLSAAEKTILSPDYPAQPDKVYLAPDPRPTSSNAEQTPALSKAPSVRRHVENTTAQPSAHIRVHGGSENPFSDRPASDDAYDGIDGK
ncbi:hypothetical protein POSPLADRAFT_1051236 [Postia placenta MAD-698-R-SB12]|uniref:Mid2 domain-containing protein n=1 Tax=Postia placenta MAD-698-R-SB12 TaxID=670580 RepID=A0A1X6NF08_9APHY|nr:hypothetical protein POSPLADRAFT_1051236 [Postia placenta MAD-698-R-SB12]OSX67082.1 hypothetical protein POSPLADRAFT_1051236 [Postia placenta MAD-698-R-SB12]